MKCFAPTLAAALLVPQPALAADGHSWQVGSDGFHVYYSDLDMNSAADRARLLARVEKAARKLCDLPLRVDENMCVAQTVSQAAAPPEGSALRMALAERDSLRMARR